MLLFTVSVYLRVTVQSGYLFLFSFPSLWEGLGEGLSAIPFLVPGGSVNFYVSRHH